MSGFPPIDRFCQFYITNGAGLEQPLNYESLTTTTFGPTFEFSKPFRVPGRREKRGVLAVICARKSSRTEHSYIRRLIPPFAAVLGCTLTACSDRAVRTLRAEDRALTETAGFLSI